jgi:hypothetical protein
VFDEYDLNIKLTQLNQATQETLNSIPGVVSRLTNAETAIGNISIDSSSLTALNDIFQQLVIDLFDYQGNFELAFAELTLQFADTN